MFAAFARRAAPVMGATRRNMSGHSHEEVRAEVAKWTKLTVVMVGLSTLLGVYNVVAHEHEHSRTGLPYQRIRNKPYPWECSDCTLFDGDCWKECRSAKN